MKNTENDNKFYPQISQIKISIYLFKKICVNLSNLWIDLVFKKPSRAVAEIASHTSQVQTYRSSQL
jgi:hypothetical protein